MNGLNIWKNQRKILTADVSWLYDRKFDMYEDIFNVVPREALLTYILFIPDTPAFDETFHHYFEVMKTIKEDYLYFNKDIDNEKLEYVCDSMLTSLYEHLPVYFSYNSLVYLGWVNNKTILLYSNNEIDENLFTIKDNLKYNYKKVFHNNKDVINSIDVIYNASYWYNLFY